MGRVKALEHQAGKRDAAKPDPASGHIHVYDTDRLRLATDADKRYIQNAPEWLACSTKRRAGIQRTRTRAGSDKVAVSLAISGPGGAELTNPTFAQPDAYHRH